MGGSALKSEQQLTSGLLLFLQERTVGGNLEKGGGQEDGCGLCVHCSLSVALTDGSGKRRNENIVRNETTTYQVIVGLVTTIYRLFFLEKECVILLQMVIGNESQSNRANTL